ncbi:MAG: enoyl-CoA hydratase/isomerase family protein, partial [Proteobacteria bacterium]|nr:enoyl-CoA hydratase/isomerase family protein [Pseudomonadota bacterium]
MAQPTFETIAYAVEGGVATVTLNRPEKLNAFNTQMMRDLIDVFDVTDKDDAVRCVIVTGAGRAFCAGADLSAGAQTFNYDARGGEDRAARQRDGVQRDGGGLLTLRIFESLKPVIAAVNGAAVGVGATMQLAMDIRLASTEARYGFVFAR